MTYDPEQIREERRAQPRLQRLQPDAADAAPAGPIKSLEETQRLLARWRDGYRLADAERWLAIVRGDKRPATPAELDAAIADLAADEQQRVETVRDGLDKKLQAEGSSLAHWIERLSRPRRLLGRGGVTTPSSTTSTRGVAC